MIIGITGGSGTGKSCASDFFAKNGFYIVDFDKISREISGKNSPCLLELCQTFGSDITDGDGNLIRKKLGDIVFSNPKKLAILNNITHKYILEHAFELVRSHKNEDIIFDAPLLFEAKLEQYCNKTIAVMTSKKVRIERITERDSITCEQAEARLQSQQSDEYYTQKSDYVIFNNGDLEEFTAKLDNVLKELRRVYNN